MSSMSLDAVHVPKISSYTRTRIERKRLFRKLLQVSETPTPTQLAKYGKMKHNVLGSADQPSQLYFSMNAVTLTKENQHLLDPRGYFTAKADGLGGLAVWTATSATESDDNKRSTMLFITRNGEARAIPCVPLFVDKVAIIDAEMCLCRRKLSNDEFHRVTNGFNVHNDDYLDYYTYRDEAAIREHGAQYDIASDEHQAQYDEQYELCCAAFDIMFYTSKCLGLKYADRIGVLHEILETDFVKPTVARRKRMVAIEQVVSAIGGPEKIPLRLFLKPVLPIHCINSAFHALPQSMYGVRVDGVVFMRADQPYSVEFSPHVLKWKPPHAQTVDFTVVRVDAPEGGDDDDDNRHYALCIMQGGGELQIVSTHVLDDTPVAALLLRVYANTKQALLPAWRLTGPREPINVLECQPVIAGGANLPGASDRAALQRKLWWRPIEWRQEKSRPNSRANYEGVCKALLNPLTEDDLVALIKASSTNATTGDVVPANADDLVPIDLPQPVAQQVID